MFSSVFQLQLLAGAPVRLRSAVLFGAVELDSAKREIVGRIVLYIILQKQQCCPVLHCCAL